MDQTALCESNTGHSGAEYREVFAYNRVANAWEPRALLPVGMCKPDAHTIGDRIFVIPRYAARAIPGGYGAFERVASNAIFEYDPAADRWTQKAPRPSYRRDFVTAIVNGKIYVIGGRGHLDNGPSPEGGHWYNTTEELKSQVEIYDPATDSWSLGRAAPYQHAGRASCAVGHQIYVFGAYVNLWDWDPSVLVYDTQANQWSAKAPLPKRIDERECVTIGDKVWLFGGIDWSAPNRSTTDRVEVYDPVADSWSFDTRMPTARYRASLARVGNEVLVFGGRVTSGFGRRLDLLELLNLDVLEDAAAP